MIRKTKTAAHRRIMPDLPEAVNQTVKRLASVAGSVAEVAAECEWCKEPFVDLQVVGEKPEPHPMCDKCLAVAAEEFGPQNH